jgi:integrase/recombinase XerD
VLTAGRGFIRISRAGGWQRLYVEDVVVVCALALALAVPNPDLETKVCPCQTSLKQLRAHFNSWLAQLCRRANVPPVTVEILAHASYLRLNDIYPNIVVGAILGQILYSPVPDDQADVFESYRQPFVLPDQSASIAAHQDDAQTEVAVSPPPNRRVVEASPVGEMAEKLIRELRDRCRPLFATTRSANRKTVVSELEAYAVEQIDCLNATIAPNVPDVKAILPAICQHLAEAGNTENTLRFNIACLALWLSHVAGQRNRAGNTIAACCSDGVNLLRLFPDLCLNELSEEEGEDILALDYAAKTKRRVLASWKSLHTFLSHLGLPVAGINWRQLAVSDRIRPVRLISQTDFQRLLAELAADGSPAAWNGFLAALLAYFAGLRVSEICRLRIEDVVLLDRPPFLRVRRSKRGKSRIVYLRYVPEEVVSLIRTHRDRRWRVTGEFGALLLVNERGEQLDPDALSKVVIEGMKRIGLRGEGQEESVVFHTLRHCCASRLLALHVDSPDITRMMGHSSPDTTARYYLHGFDFLQRERLREYRDPLLSQPELGYVSQDRAAQLLGVSRRHVRNLVARMTRQTGRSIDLLPHSKLFRKRRAGKEELYLSLQDLAILLAFRLTSKDDVLPSITAQSSTSPLA